MRLAGSREASKERGPKPLRNGPGSDPVNNVSPEMAAAGKKYAERYEEVFMAGYKLWNAIKKEAAAKGELPKKLYFIGTNGNNGDFLAEAVLDSLAYIPAPDGTPYLNRKPGVEYPPMMYYQSASDQKVAEKTKITATDLFMEDEKRYRELEMEVLKEYDALESQAEDGTIYPSGIVVGDSAVVTPENIEIMKKGLVIWIDVGAEYSWAKTQYRPRQAGGLYSAPSDQQRPPVWAVANGWDGDVDDAEAKMEYIDIVRDFQKTYESIADVRVRADVPGIEENAVWGAGRIVKALSEHLGLNTEDEASVEDEVMERDIEKFLEGARLSKYVKPAMAWCDEMGAASIEDVLENVPEFMEALKLKPLERKRLEKAAAAAAV